MKTKLILLCFGIFLFSLTTVNAVSTGVVKLGSGTSSLNLNTNNSRFWNSLEFPSQIPGAEFWYNQTTGGSSIFVDTSGDTMTGLLTLSNGLTITGNTNINGGWLNNGTSFINGDIFTQTLYQVNVTQLNVGQLNINGSIVPAAGFSNMFDIGSPTVTWQYGYFGTDVLVNGQSVKTWLYNQTYTGGTYNATYQSYNTSFGKYWYNQTGTGIYYYNQTTASNLSIVTAYGKWFYNMSDGSYNISYQNYAYNQTYTGGTFNTTYEHALYNDSNANLTTLNVSTRFTVGNNLFVNSTSVGIGTSTPKGKLEISSSSNLNAVMMGINVSTINTYVAAGLTQPIYGIYSYAYSVGNAGISNTYAGFFNSSTTGGSNYGIYATAGGGSPNWAGYFDGGDVFINNNLGIGSRNPLGKLDVNGSDMYFGDTSNSARTLLFRRSGATVGAIGTANSQLNFYGGAVAANHLAITTAGKIGFNTSSPSYLFEFNGQTANILNVSNKFFVTTNGVGISNSTTNYNFEVTKAFGATSSPSSINTEISTSGGATGPATSYFSMVGLYSVINASNPANDMMNGTAISANANGNGGASAYNIGIFSTATGGAFNYAAWFDDGNVTIKNRLGIGTIIPDSALDVHGDMNVTNLASISENLTIKRKVISIGTAPSIANCGTGATITGTDMAGTIVSGAGITACVATFNQKYTTAPTCVVTNRAGMGNAFTYSTTNTALTITLVGVLTDTYDYICIGH